MNLLQSVILAFVEGVTEFLPISSTAHLVLTADLLMINQSNFVKSFEIIIQLGAILSVAVLYVRKLLSNSLLLVKIVIAFLPTGIIGFGLYGIVKNYLLGSNWVAIAALFAGGIAMLKFEFINANLEKTVSINALPVWKLLFIGVCQSLAIVPGVSRALMTIGAGRLMGLSRGEAVEMSFLLALPTMAAASGWDLLKTGFMFGSYEWSLLAVGFGGAFVSALIVVKWLIKYVQKHDMKMFGWYRIGLALIWGVISVGRGLP